MILLIYTNDNKTATYLPTSNFQQPSPNHQLPKQQQHWDLSSRIQGAEKDKNLDMSGQLHQVSPGA